MRKTKITWTNELIEEFIELVEIWNIKSEDYDKKYITKHSTHTEKAMYLFSVRLVGLVFYYYLHEIPSIILDKL